MATTMTGQTIAAESVPLRIGAPEDFARVRESLRAAEFDEATVCRALKIPDMAELGRVKMKDIDFASLSVEFALFIRLFVLMESVSREEVEKKLAPDVLASFRALDLLRVGNTLNITERYYTPVFFYPVANLLIASDRHDNPDGSEFTPPPDIVFPAIFAGTLRFLRLIGKSPATEVLDLCAGSGVGALQLSHNAKRAVASDVTARAAHYAEFNALMNECPNVEILTGDLYAAVEGRTFDRIIAHPPYMPSLRDATLWRDGGETGERLVRRIVEGLPQSLRTGGTAYIVCLGIDTKDGQFEERARVWLGTTHEEFDLFFAYADEKSPKSVAQNIVARASDAEESDAARLEHAFEQIGTVRLVYGALVVHRRAQEFRNDAAWTTRLRISTEAEGEHLEWILDWHRKQMRAGFLERLQTARPRLAPFLLVEVKHGVVEGELVPARYTLEAVAPFISAMNIDGWAVPLIAGFDGEKTIAEIHTTARANKAMPDDFMLEDFTRLVAMLIERCYLVLNDNSV